MEIIKISPKGFGANSYILTSDGKNAVVIDPSSERVFDKCLESNLVPAYVLLTHCHFDHTLAVALFQANGAKVVCLDKEEKNFNSGVDLYEYFGAPKTPFTIDETVADGEVRTLADIPFLVRSTPGHTTGSACYIVESERALFTGDTLFAGTIGRTDFPTGSMSSLRESLRSLGKLQGDYTVYAGHNEDTTLDAERKSNPFLLF